MESAREGASTASVEPVGTSVRGVQLCGRIAARGRKVRCALVLCHSFKGDAEYQPVMREALTSLPDQGLSVCTFDCEGAGRSAGDYARTTVQTQVEDCRAVVAALRERGYDRFVLGGISLGAVVALLSEVEGTIGHLLWSPCLAMHTLGERYADSFADAEPHERVIVIARGDGAKVRLGRAMVDSFFAVPEYEGLLPPAVPLLSIYGAGEHITSLPRARRAHESRGPTARMVLVDDADHDFRSRAATASVLSLSADWLRGLVGR